ncbi:unnamed protein product [Calypogeia fissa]
MKEFTTSGLEANDRKLIQLRVLVEEYCRSRHLNGPQTVAISTTVMGLVKIDGIRTKLPTRYRKDYCYYSPAVYHHVFEGTNSRQRSHKSSSCGACRKVLEDLGNGTTS